MGIINQENNLKEEIKNQTKILARLRRTLARRQRALKHEMKKYYLPIKKSRESGKKEEEKSLAKFLVPYDKKISKLELINNQLISINQKLSLCLSYYELSTILIEAKGLFDNKIPMQKVNQLIEMISTDACNKEIWDSLIDEIIYSIFGDFDKEINDEDINLFLDNFFNFICKGLDPPLNQDNQIQKKIENEEIKKDENEK